MCLKILPSLGLEVANLPKRTWGTITQIRTVSVDRIGGLIERLPPETHAPLVGGLNEIIG